MRLSWLLAIALVLPSASAYHLSVGADDTVLIGPSESPEDPSVDDVTWERGTSTACDHGEATEDPSVLMADALCGLLVYNQEVDSYTTTSPVDQLSRQGITVDMVMTSYVGAYGTTSCQPWCSSPTTYKAIHDAGASLGLTDDGQTAYQGDQGTQTYGGNLYHAGSHQVVQATGQSWLLPVTDTSFVAFVEDAAGDPIDQATLTAIVQTAISEGQLPPTAEDKVCAYSPQAHLGSHAADSGSTCELTLRWTGSTGDGYQDPCSSPAYLCGSLQPAWRATSMCPMWHAACYLSDAWNSAHHFAVWHTVVAPASQDCSLAEPGFDTASDSMLAHDLDIYEPPTDETPLEGVPFLWDEASQNVPGLGPLREGRAPDLSELPAVQATTEPLPFTEHDPEPNSQDWRGISESTGQLTEARSLTACDELGTTEEEVDPWINLIDGHTTQDLMGLGVPAGSQPDPDAEPGPRLTIQGKVGIFADVDDDGAYDQAPFTDVFEGIEAHGAYPILWDHHAPGEGCQFRSGQTIGDLGHEAGYTDPTGLVVVLRMTGALVDTRTGDALPVTGAAVLLSANLDSSDPAVQDVLTQAVGQREAIIVDDAFQPQCEEATGGFTSHYEAYVPVRSQGDGMVTAAITTLAEQGPGGGSVPAAPITLASGTHIWYDVDPWEPSLD